MTAIQHFLTNYPKVGFFMMVCIVLVITTLIKLPLKHLTKKIKNEKLRKFCNSFFILLALGVGIGVGWLYCHFCGQEFKLEVGFLLSLMGVSTYDLLEIIKRAFAFTLDCIKKGKEMKLKDITNIIEDVTDKNPNKEIVSPDVKNALEQFDNILNGSETKKPKHKK